MKIIGVYNLKGGVGKTAATVNLAYYAASLGNRVLACDMDPQGALGFHFRIRPVKKFNHKKLIDQGESLFHFIRESDFEHLDILPSDFTYRKLDVKLHDEKKSKSVLRKHLHELKDDYDYIFIDSPPAISLTTENIINAADIIVHPLIPIELSIRTYYQLINHLKKKDQPKVDHIFPFFSLVSSRNKKQHYIIEDFRQKITLCLETMVPKSAFVERMASERKPVFKMGKNNAAIRAYTNLWNEIITKLE